MAELLTFLGSSVMGTFLGGVFALLNKKQEIGLEMSRLTHAQSMRDKDIQLAKEEIRGITMVAGEHTEAARFIAIGKTAEADKLDPELLKQAGWWRWLFVLVEAYRKAMRPLVTTLVLAAALISSYIIFTHLDVTWVTLTSKEKTDLVLQTMAWVFGQSSAAVSYWLVARGTPR